MKILNSKNSIVPAKNTNDLSQNIKKLAMARLSVRYEDTLSVVSWSGCDPESSELFNGAWRELQSVYCDVKQSFCGVDLFMDAQREPVSFCHMLTSAWA